MAPIATYVFIDLETTGLPREEMNRTKITELSMVAVKRQHILDTRPGATPRVQHKLTLCFNPGRIVQPSCTTVTGLDNELLEFEPFFNLQSFNIINTFINVLTKPVCLIAQNGLGFDFPIIKSYLVKLNVSFSEDLMCADCYHAFYDIMEMRKVSECKDPSVIENVQSDPVPKICTESSEESTSSMQLKNEMTPKQSIIHTQCKTPIKANEYNVRRISKARRRFPWSEGNKPKEKYKLKYIYERLLKRPALEAHRAENDCILALECAVALSNDFIMWVDDNHCPFADINPMTIGIPLGE